MAFSVGQLFIENDIIADSLVNFFLCPQRLGVSRLFNGCPNWVMCKDPQANALEIRRWIVVMGDNKFNQYDSQGVEIAIWILKKHVVVCQCFN